MLRNGKFIKEETIIKVAPYDTGKIKIGEHYVPNIYPRAATPEERFAQGLILGVREQRPSLLSKFFGLMLRV
jgi:hypothetical protein